MQLGMEAEVMLRLWKMVLARATPHVLGSTDVCSRRHCRGSSQLFCYVLRVDEDIIHEDFDAGNVVEQGPSPWSPRIVLGGPLH